MSCEIGHVCVLLTEDTDECDDGDNDDWSRRRCMDGDGPWVVRWAGGQHSESTVTLNHAHSRPGESDKLLTVQPRDTVPALLALPPGRISPRHSARGRLAQHLVCWYPILSSPNPVRTLQKNVSSFCAKSRWRGNVSLGWGYRKYVFLCNICDLALIIQWLWEFLSFLVIVRRIFAFSKSIWLWSLQF